MAKGKLIASKVIVGIFCVLLIAGAVFTSVALYISSKMPNVPEELTTHYDNLPNIMGDDGVYVSKSFFIENDLEIPQYVTFYHVNRNRINQKNGYTGRAKGFAYDCASERMENDGKDIISVLISCDYKGIKQLKNKQKYNEYTYGLTTNHFISNDDSETMVTRYTYSVNFKRNENTSKQCQLSMTVSIEHNKDISSEEYRQICNTLFYSMLDNVVYRNI